MATHLAAAAARVGHKVLLVEATFRRPTLAKRLGLPVAPGLSDVLAEDLDLDDAIHRVPTGPYMGRRGNEAAGPELDVLLAHAPTSVDPTGIMESPAVRKLLYLARERYDFVYLDAAALSVSDAYALLGVVDGVVVVGRPGKDKRNDVRRASQSLRAVGAPSLGVITNAARSTIASPFNSAVLAPKN